MSLHHISITVNDIDKIRDFYLAALKPLGYKVFMTFQEGKVVGLGSSLSGPVFWLASSAAPTADGDKRHKDMDFKKEAEEMKQLRQVTGPMHVAFSASNRQQVRAFYDAAMSVKDFTQFLQVDDKADAYSCFSAAGAKCNGPPGLRQEYFATYYGAFVLDPDGRNIEAVCMKPGFWAEPWGVVGWSFVGLVGGAAGGVCRRDAAAAPAAG